MKIFRGFHHPTLAAQCVSLRRVLLYQDYVFILK